MKFGPGFTVFVIFFAVSIIEAFRTSNWLEVAFWLAVGFAFFVADNVRKWRSRAKRDTLTDKPTA